MAIGNRPTSPSRVRVVQVSCGRGGLGVTVQGKELAGGRAGGRHVPVLELFSTYFMGCRSYVSAYNYSAYLIFSSPYQSLTHTSLLPTTRGPTPPHILT